VKRLLDDVQRELSRFGPQAGMSRIVEVWPAAVGATIARHAWPARIGRDGTLYVHTSSSAWAFELGQLAADVLRKLGDAGANVPPKLRFVVGKLPEPEPEERPASAPAPGPADVARAAELAAAIEDEELREVVARAAARSLASGR